MRTLPSTVLLGLLLAAPPPPSAAQDIDTRTGQPGYGGSLGNIRPPEWWDWGPGHVSRGYGQTFTVAPGWTELNEFAFWMSNWGSGPDLVFRAYLMAWDPVGRRPQGVLWQSERREGPGTGQSLVRYGFGTGGVTLDPGSMYLAFLSSHNDLMTGLPYGRARLVDVHGRSGSDSLGHDAYAGGSAVSGEFFLDAAADGTAPFIHNVFWSVSSPEDAWFTADFAPTPTSTVPEPASMALLGTGLAGLAGWRRRRKQREA